MTPIIYTPDKKVIKNRVSYWEVWEGLPDLDFENANSRDGSESLRYDSNGNYIWIPNDVLNAVRQNPEAILLALNANTGSKMTVRWLSPQAGKLEDIIKKAKRLNGEKQNP